MKEKILSEIERLKKEHLGSPESVLNDIESFIESMEQESVDKDLESEIDDYINGNFSECADGILLSDASGRELTLLDVSNAARHFAQWQLVKATRWIEQCCDSDLLGRSFLADFKQAMNIQS